MKRIKNFLAFFESKGTWENYSSYLIITKADDMYGIPQAESFRYTGEMVDDNELHDANDMFEECVDADHGLIHGPDSFRNLSDAYEEWEEAEDEDEKEEAISSIQYWIDHFEFSCSAKDLINGVVSLDELKEKYLAKARIDYYAGYLPESKDVWNFIVFGKGTNKTEIGEPIRNLEYAYSYIKEFLEIEDGALIFAFKKRDPFYYIVEPEKHKFKRTKIKRGNEKGLFKSQEFIDTGLGEDLMFIISLPYEIALEIYLAMGKSKDELDSFFTLKDMGLFLKK
jgi:hypothetical protein